MTDANLSVLTPERPPEGTATIVGVVLAAGRSQRFGDQNKLLAPLAGEPLVRHAVETLLETPLSSVYAVVGHESDRVREAVADLPVTILENADYGEGQATSVRTAIEGVGEDVEAVLFALADMPSVAPESVEKLIAAYEHGASDALAAAHCGERGNPVLFDRRHFEALSDVDGDVGGREILLSDEQSALVETRDPGVRRDVDTPADLQALQDEHR